MTTLNTLLQKYDVPVPRYTSYPTVPYWSQSPTVSEWVAELQKAAAKAETHWSLYLHIPFCETLCTFCGCNTSITKDHNKESAYVENILKEWELYLKHVPDLRKRPLRQIHLGGGSPTFLSTDNLIRLVTPFLQSITRDKDFFEGSIEVDPRRTTQEQLAALRKLGFTRISMGVQDFNEEVQRLVNRIQPLSITKQLTTEARALGYESINYDLIYGLAKQTLSTMAETVKATIELRPDRIALYSLALVPWIKPAQRLFKDEDLPKGEEKRALYELARTELLKADYIEIGMDHFALRKDALAKARDAGTLHRNFMGYTDVRSEILLGLGVSAISETPSCFHQNEKILPVYERLLKDDKLPSFRGHLLTAEDRALREQILSFMTKGHVRLLEQQKQEANILLAEMLKDGLVKIDSDQLVLTDLGRPFLRNACVLFDKRLRAKEPSTRIFSSAI